MSDKQSTPQKEAIKQAHSGFKLMLLDLKFIEGNLKNLTDLNDAVLNRKIYRAANSIYKCMQHVETKYNRKEAEHA